MKIKSKKKKIKQKSENLDKNNDQESLEVDILKRNFLKKLDNNEDSLNQKIKYFKYNNCIKKLHFFAYLKIKKKYDCTLSKYNNIILNYLLDNMDCHLVSQFKEKMIMDYKEEFLRRKYKISEIKERIPKFSIYYKNYLNFFCKPTYNCFKFNKIIQNYGEKKAEIYYKENYQVKETNDEENIGMEESSSNESSNGDTEYKFSEEGIIFNKTIKEKLDNVTVMTTISTTGNNTINLNINNEKIEVFSENKAEISNDTTIGDIIDDIKKEMKEINKKKKTKKKFKYSHRNYMNYSLKIQDNYKEGRPNKNLSIENRKKINPKDISKKILLNKSNKDKSKIKFSNGKLISKNIKSQISKYNIESYKINKNRLNKLSHEKIHKILKNRDSKNTYNSIYNMNFPYYNFSKDSKTNIRNISSNVKSTENRYKKTNISGFTDQRKKYKSRNNLDSLYKYGVGGVNTTTGKSTNANFKTTHFNKNSLTNLVKSGNKAFKTMNFTKTAVHQRTNSQLMQNQILVKNNMNGNNNKKNILDGKTSSLKFLVTENENQAHQKHAIKIKKNEKLKNKNINVNNVVKNINNKNKSINKNESNTNQKITVTTNNYFHKLNNKNSKTDNERKKKTIGESKDVQKSNNNPNYSNNINNLNPQQLLYKNEECQTLQKNVNCNYNYKANRNGNLMQIALSLLIDNNSPSKKNNINNNISNITSLNNNNDLMKNNPNQIRENKNNNFNINSPTHYNININNQINININGKINGKTNNIRKIKFDQKNSKKKININVSKKQKNKYIPIKKPIQNINYINNNASNYSKSNNKIKIRTRNYNDYLKNGLTQKSNNTISRNDKIIKGYHAKSVSNLAELIKHNNKLIEIYKSMSKSKEKN